ncbi:MAG: hypothetical protein RLZZ338_1689 [Cyanobacteriota bacterium]|jgi:hypothetical protein
MVFQLEKVIPWGRNLDEYIRMFNLTASDLQLNILDCASGPASFNVEMTAQGYQVISSDPIYQFTAEEIAQRIQDTYQTVINGVSSNFDHYIWTNIKSPEELGKVRMAAMEKFIKDFPLGFSQGRYMTSELPYLPFHNSQFDLALSSHFLFAYSEHFSGEFHVNALRELCRVAGEIRIFPLLTISGEISPFVALAQEKLETEGYLTEIQTVSYEFQKGGNQMLLVKRASKLFFT